jgi:heterodisulfide reductase subunit C
VLQQLEGIDENLFDVITDIMDEKREDWKDFLADQEDAEDED